MKKMLFSCTLILSGIIGFIGTLIASAYKSTGGYSRILNCLNGSDYVLAILFVGIFLIGMFISFKQIK